jgi:hypothetical protein
VFVVVGVEQPQLLPAMHGIEGVVDVEHDPPWHLAEAVAVDLNHRPSHAQQAPYVGQVLQPRDGRLGTEGRRPG